MEIQNNNNDEQIINNNVQESKNGNSKFLIIFLIIIIILLILSFSFYIFLDKNDIERVSSDCENQECLEEAARYAEVKYCELITDNYIKQVCYSTIAVQTRDVKICRLMDEASRILSNCEESAKNGRFIMIQPEDIENMDNLPVEVVDSLNAARDKGDNAKAKAILAAMRSEAELYFDRNSNTFLGFCNSENVSTLLNEAKNATELEAYCNDTDTYWAAEVGLKLDEGFFCADSTGFAGKNPQSIGPSITSCK